MNEDELKYYEKAGEISHKAKMEGKRLVKPGASALEVAEKLEKMIFDLGAKPAFPVNLSVNEEAAHYTPGVGDERVFTESDVVKIDVGAHVNGFIGDTALTVDLSGENSELVAASADGLEAALSVVRAGADLKDVGSAVEKAIKAHGFKPIENLTGHSLKKFRLHAGLSIPSISVPYSKKLSEGDVIAIEPFASAGSGKVNDGPVAEIFSLISKKPVRMREARRIRDFVLREYNMLPFAERWIAKQARSKLMLDSAMKELVLSGCFRQYPVLRDSGLVSQKEVTVLIEKDSCRILTK